MMSEDRWDSGSTRWAHIRENLRSVEAAAIAGIVHSILLIIALTILLATPNIGASQEEIEAYYQNPSLDARGMLAFNLVVFSMIGFIWFVAVIRHRIGEREPRFFATIFFGGGILYAALTLIGTAVLAAPLVLIEVAGRDPDPLPQVSLVGDGQFRGGGRGGRAQIADKVGDGKVGLVAHARNPWHR